MSAVLQRLPGWPERLAAYIEERRAMPFAWGSNDCATFAAGAVKAVTGADVLAALRGRWATEAEAAAEIERQGGLYEALRAALGSPLKNVALAGRGAVVLADMAGTAVVGVLLDAHWCAPGAQGLEFRPSTEVRLAWGF